MTLTMLCLLACSETPKSVTDHDGDGVDDALDCDPWNSANGPGLTEICDGIDNDCDDLVDEADPDLGVQGYVDLDGDGYPGTATTSCEEGLPTGSTDCDDADEDVNPGEDEDCATEADDDCDGSNNAVDAEDCEPWFIDADGDGQGGEDWVCACDAIEGYTTQEAGDCDDSNPGASDGDSTCWLEGEYLEGTEQASWVGARGDDDVTDPTGFARVVEGAGDVDGDGTLDLLFGRYGDDTSGENAGAVYVVLGPPVPGEHDAEDADAILRGAEADQGLGWSVAGLGDVDGDGYGDLLLGAYNQSFDEADANVARLVYGPVAGDRVVDDGDPGLFGSDTSPVLVAGVGRWEPGGDLLVLDTSDGERRGVFQLGAPTSDLADLPSAASGRVQTVSSSGYLTLGPRASGDNDGDGVPDLWAGGWDTLSTGESGKAIWAFSGGVSGVWTTADADAMVSGADTHILWDIDNAGDLDGDGLDDLIVGGSWDEDEDEFFDTYGEVWVVLAPLDGTTDLSAAAARIDGLANDVFSGHTWSDNLGGDVASPGDLNGDGIDELLTTGEGKFGLYYGPFSGVMSYEDASAQFGIYNRLEEEAEVFPVEYGWGSASVAGPGDLDGDGTPDLLLGSDAAYNTIFPDYFRADAVRFYSGTPEE